MQGRESELGHREDTEGGEREVEFELEAPDANEVAVTGTFSGWQDTLPMTREDRGQWRRTVQLPPGRYEYRFIVDGEWCEDPESRETVPNPYGSVNSVVEVR
jgi:1,4-alpha-glucan branching enzyme